MNAEQIRFNNRVKLNEIGIELPSEILPLLADNNVSKSIKSGNEIYSRSMVLFSTICVALSETKDIKLENIDVVNEWLKEYELYNFLTLPEKDLLNKKNISCNKFVSEVESLAALMWSLNLYEMKPIDYVGNDFGEIFPNILNNSNPFTSSYYQCWIITYAYIGRL